jgi:serine/threonine protein phosphatase PrpC
MKKKGLHMPLSTYGHSDVGFVRENNEDSFLVEDSKGIFAVADGVGGLPFGNLASKLAVQFFDSMVGSTNDCMDLDTLKKISHKIHRNIISCGELVGGDNGIGTTFSAIRMIGDQALFSHVGDSTIFTHHELGLQKISKCHTLRDELIEKHGENAALDMPEHYGHTLTRCMGQDIDFEVDLGHIEIKQGTSILICSDGITNMVPQDEIESSLKTLDPKEAVTQLVDKANQNGGIDNSTAVCIKVI